MVDINGTYKGTMHSICEATKNTYLQSFHFRIISRIIATKKLLHTIGICDDNLCDFCNLFVEDIVHLFWSCTHIKLFVDDVIAYLSNEFSLQLNINKKLWFFPKLGKLKPIEIIIITVAKVVIYSAKRKNQYPSLQHFRATLLLEAKKEYGVALLKGTPEVYHNKWGMLGNIT